MARAAGRGGRACGSTLRRRLAAWNVTGLLGQAYVGPGPHRALGTQGLPPGGCSRRLLGPGQARWRADRPAAAIAPDPAAAGPGPGAHRAADVSVGVVPARG